MEVSVSSRIRNIVIRFMFMLCVCSFMYASTTGSITVGGTEQVSAGGVWDSGTVTLTINGPVLNPGSYSKSVIYGQYSTPASIASALAAAFSQDCNSPAWAQAVGAQINFRMKASATNLTSLTLTSTQNLASAFSGPSFTTGGIAVSSSGQPVILSLLMTNGYTGTPITLNGINFGTSGTVTFNGVPGIPTSWTPTSITVPIPPNATSGLVVVTTFGMTSNGVPIVLSSAVSCPVQ